MIDDNDDVAIATITVAELRVGVELCRGKMRLRRQKFLDDVLANVPVIDYDLEVADAHARLLVFVRQQGRPRGAHDLVIAATALASQRTVLTADQTAFSDLPGIELRLAGNQVQLLDYDLEELRRKAGPKAKEGREFWRAVRRDAIVLVGSQLDDLLGGER